MTLSSAGETLRLSERTSTYVCAAFSLVVALLFLKDSLSFFPMPSSQDVGPGGVPALVALIMALAAMALALRPAHASAAIEVREPRRAVATLVLLVSFVLGLTLSLNAWVLVTAFVFALQLAQGERRWLYLIAGTLLLTFAVWVVFGWLLDVPLPL